MDAGVLTLGGESARLVEAAAAGDAVAFDDLVRLHGAGVYRLALRMLGNPQDAEDVQQETFVQAYRRLRSFRGEAAFGTWLYAIAARLCLGKLRRRRRHSEELPGDLPSDPELDPQEHLTSLAAAQRVQRALGALSPSDRLLILLKYVEDLSHEEIAGVLGCSCQSSRSRLLRAKRLFRAHYQELEST